MRRGEREISVIMTARKKGHYEKQKLDLTNREKEREP